jgi:hypothetical protein
MYRLQFIDITAYGSKIYFYIKEGDINSVVSQASCRMGWTLLELQVETDIEKQVIHNILWE